MLWWSQLGTAGAEAESAEGTAASEAEAVQQAEVYTLASGKST
jgi:hypothetical protein